LNAAISISYPAAHRKGDGQILDGAEHADMLYRIVQRYRSEVDWPIFIGCTGFDGLTPYTREASERERELLWKLFAMPKVWFVTVPEKTGHLEGSTWSIRQGIEAAKAMGCRYLVHSCEDVIPEFGVVEMLVRRLEQNRFYYLGELWREIKTELSTQFFICNVPWFYKNFNGKGNGKLVEAYMADILDPNTYGLMHRVYRHTHTPSQFFKWLEE
jgi:hypothetical protein